MLKWLVFSSCGNNVLVSGGYSLIIIDICGLKNEEVTK